MPYVYEDDELRSGPGIGGKYPSPPKVDLRAQMEKIANGGVVWWAYKDVPALAGTIVQLLDRVAALEARVESPNGPLAKEHPGGPRAQMPSSSEPDRS